MMINHGWLEDIWNRISRSSWITTLNTWRENVTSFTLRQSDVFRHVSCEQNERHCSCVKCWFWAAILGKHAEVLIVVVVRAAANIARMASYHIATFQMKRGGANVRASTRLNQLHPSRTQLVHKFRGPAPEGAAGQSLVSGGVSPEWRGFVPSLTFMRQEKKFRFSLFRWLLEVSPVAPLPKLLWRNRPSPWLQRKTPKCTQNPKVRVRISVFVCARICVDAVQPSSWAEALWSCRDEAALSSRNPAEHRSPPGFLVPLVMPQVGSSCR